MVAKLPEIPLGAAFGRLSVTSSPVRKGNDLYVSVLCVCGVAKQVSQGNLRSGRVNSCGCLNRELAKARATHAMSKTPVYAVWNVMRQRCENPKDKGYVNYGGRGIKVCDKWQAFEGFLEDMGLPPFRGAMLDRKDNDQGYNKENCQWVSRTEQNRNTRKSITFLYNGEQLTLGAIAELKGMNLNTLRTRVYKYGMAAQEAADTPVLSACQSGAMAGNPLFETVNKRQDGELLYPKKEIDVIQG